MKLKIRLSTILLTIILGTFFLTFTYFIKLLLESNSFGELVPLKNANEATQQNEPSRAILDGASIFLVPSTNGMANIEILKLLNGKFDKKYLHKRRRRRKKVLNETNADSNRALEEQDDRLSYKLLDEKEIIARYAQKNRFHEPDSNLKARYLKECEGLERFDSYDNHRKKYPDLLSILRKIQNSNSRYSRITMQETGDVKPEKNRTLLQKFNLRISNLDVYEENDSTIDVLLYSMATMPIIHIAEKTGGTQLKLLVTYQDRSQAILKPMRFERSQKTNPNHFYFNDFEKHTSEIAAFHLDRILGFRRCVPVVGREFSITQDIYMIAETDLLKTFFISPAGNICFHGQCRQYCDTSHAICGKPDSLEVSLAALLPTGAIGERDKFKNPWRRSYHKRRKAEWEINNDYCHLVRQQPIYNNTKLLADIVDASILDFLAGNMDRHHYEVFKVFGKDSFILHLDNGRGFGKPHHDEISILAPVLQCCFIHKTTFHRLMQLQHSGPKLSKLMFCSLYKDPITPVLFDDHLDALDRRLEIVIQAIRECLQKHPVNQVLFSYENKQKSQ